MILVNILTSLGLIGLGSFLEVYFYVERFLAEGLGIIVASIIGLSLTLLLNVLVGQQWPWRRILIAILLAYSTFATSSGQNVAYMTRVEEETVDSTQNDALQEELVLAQERRQNALENIRQLQDGINEIPFDQRWRWKNTLADAEKEIERLSDVVVSMDETIENYKNELDLRDDSDVVSIDIYERLGELFGISSVLLAVLVQTLLSFFIALMAPVGILVMKDVLKTRRVISKKSHIDKMLSEYIDVQFNQKNKLLYSVKLMQKKLPHVPGDIMTAWNEGCLKYGLADKKGRILSDDIDAIKATLETVEV